MHEPTAPVQSHCKSLQQYQHLWRVLQMGLLIRATQDAVASSQAGLGGITAAQQADRPAGQPSPPANTLQGLFLQRSTEDISITRYRQTLLPALAVCQTFVPRLCHSQCAIFLLEKKMLQTNGLTGAQSRAEHGSRAARLKCVLGGSQMVATLWKGATFGSMPVLTAMPLCVTHWTLHIAQDETGGHGPEPKLGTFAWRGPLAAEAGHQRILQGCCTRYNKGLEARQCRAAAVREAWLVYSRQPEGQQCGSSPRLAGGQCRSAARFWLR
jgi:hypothetical protein